MALHELRPLRAAHYRGGMLPQLLASQSALHIAASKPDLPCVLLGILGSFWALATWTSKGNRFAQDAIQQVFFRFALLLRSVDTRQTASAQVADKDEKHHNQQHYTANTPLSRFNLQQRIS